jgi:Ca2+-binding EF-hand superfamily protein
MSPFVFFLTHHNHHHTITGNLDHDEVKLALMEMGMEVSDGDVDDMLQEFDTDHNGTIDLEEFKVIYANSTESEFDW